jgi:hypothetical protein
VHSKAKEVVDLWLERSDLASNPSAPLFPSFGKNRESMELRPLDRRSVLKLVEKRAKASGILLLESLVGEVRKHIDASGVFC